MEPLVEKVRTVLTELLEEQGRKTSSIPAMSEAGLMGLALLKAWEDPVSPTALKLQKAVKDVLRDDGDGV